MAILAMFLRICTGRTPVILMGKMPMLRSEMVTYGICPVFTRNRTVRRAVREEARG